jgi:hypothetical protein
MCGDYVKKLTKRTTRNYAQWIPAILIRGVGPAKITRSATVTNMLLNILENSASRLVIQVAAYRRGLLIAGICWLIGLVLAFSAWSTTFTCKRVEPREGSCELTTTALLNSSTQRFSLRQIEKVRTLTSTTTDNRGRKLTNYSVQIQTTSGSVAIINASDSGEQHQWIDQINTFLSNGAQQELTLNRDGRLGFYVVSAVFLGFGLWIAILILRETTYTFDRTSGMLAIEQHLAGTWTKECPLDDIRDLEIRLYENPRDDRKNYRRVFIELKSDRYITTNLPDDTDLINLIRTFVGMYNRSTP